MMMKVMRILKDMTIVDNHLKELDCTEIAVDRLHLHHYSCWWNNSYKLIDQLLTN